MDYDLKLNVTYLYDQPSDRTRNLLRLLPSDSVGVQRVASRLLTIQPRTQERREFLDFFGNATTMVAFHDPVEELSITLRARVHREAEAPALDLSPPLPELPRDLSERRTLAPSGPQHFLGASPRIAISPTMTAFARAALPDKPSVLQAVQSVGAALHTEMRFDPDATDAMTSPQDAFDARHGVCQDFSQVMIACLRGLGIPAGYVSGFLRTVPPEGQPRLEGADAMHAWVRAWCGAESGWVEYDPTNDLLVTTDHVVMAVGRDYADVSPVRGVGRSSGGQTTRHSVDVIPLDQD